MKLSMVVIVLIIAVATVDCTDFPDGYEDLNAAAGEPEGYNSAKTEHEPKEYAHHFYSNLSGHIQPRAGSRCKAKDVCLVMGGSCVTNATLCKGRLVPEGCKGTKCQCCVPGSLETKIHNLEKELQTMQANITNANSKLSMEFQSMRDDLTDADSKHNMDFQTLKDNLTDANSKLNKEFQSMRENLTDTISNMVSKLDSSMKSCNEGFFQTAGSSKCYKLYNDTERSWTDAKGKCQTEGLVLAEPDNPLSLRKYLVETYGQQTAAYAYLGARGTGSYFRWERSGRQISNSDSLWQYRSSSTVSSSYCLLILVEKNTYLAKYPNQPYYAESCTSKYFTVCEYI